MIGNKVIQYNVYNRSSGKARFIFDTTSVKRPSLELPADAIKGSGIMGEIALPTPSQLASLTYGISFRRANTDAITLFEQKMQDIEIRWAVDTLDPANSKVKIESNKEIVKGIPKKLDLGKTENNSTQDAEYEMEVLYYNHIIDGKSVIEIDKLNGVFKVNGIDYNADIRAAL